MQWTESTPINITNLNDLESRIDQANTNVTNAKTPIAQSITDMGQAASASDAFTVLAAKIKDISKDADVATGEVLSPKTFYQGGTKRAGTMPNRAGDTAALASSFSGNTLKLRASDGYRDGIDDNVTITENNWVESNIKQGVNMFGKPGTYNPMVFTAGIAHVLAARSFTTNFISEYYTRYVEFTVNWPGTVRTYFEMANGAGGGGIYGRIYVNGVARGTERYLGGSIYTYVGYTEDIAVNAGDLVQFYFRSTDTSNSQMIRNCQLKVNEAINMTTIY